MLSEVNSESEEVEDKSTLSKNIVKPGTLEILMDAPSSSPFADLIPNILMQLGFSRTDSKNATGLNLYIYIHAHVAKEKG